MVRIAQNFCSVEDISSMPEITPGGVDCTPRGRPACMAARASGKCRGRVQGEAQNCRQTTKKYGVAGRVIQINRSDFARPEIWLYGRRRTGYAVLLRIGSAAMLIESKLDTGLTRIYVRVHLWPSLAELAALEIFRPGGGRDRELLRCRARIARHPCWARAGARAARPVCFLSSASIQRDSQSRAT